jgi:hypothetical protein
MYHARIMRKLDAFNHFFPARYYQEMVAMADVVRQARRAEHPTSTSPR